MKINKNYHSTKDGVIKKNPPKKNTTKVAFYKWGQYIEEQEIAIKDLKNMTMLSSDDLLGFDLRSQDENKNFYAEENDIEYSDDEGTGVKRAYGTSKYITTGE